LITDRMLKMFKRDDAPKKKLPHEGVRDPGRVSRGSLLLHPRPARPDESRHGAPGHGTRRDRMVLAVIGTLLPTTTSSATSGSSWGLVVGSAIGAAMAILLPMTAVRSATASRSSFARWRPPWSASPSTCAWLRMASGTMAALGFEGAARFDHHYRQPHGVRQAPGADQSAPVTWPLQNPITSCCSW